jgi:hypothetical protein
LKTYKKTIEVTQVFLQRQALQPEPRKLTLRPTRTAATAR